MYLFTRGGIFEITVGEYTKAFATIHKIVTGGDLTINATISGEYHAATTTSRAYCTYHVTFSVGAAWPCGLAGNCCYQDSNLLGMWGVL